MKLCGILLMAGAMLLSGNDSAVAQDPSPSKYKVLAAKSIRCQYTSTTLMNYRSKPKLTKSSEPPVTFDSINYKDGTAREIGKMGAGTVQVILTPTTLSFVEITPSGPVIDTVFTESESAGKYQAVTSRHRDLIAPMPSQSYGLCWVLD